MDTQTSHSTLNDHNVNELALKLQTEMGQEFQFKSNKIGKYRNIAARLSGFSGYKDYISRQKQIEEEIQSDFLGYWELHLDSALVPLLSAFNYREAMSDGENVILAAYKRQSESRQFKDYVSSLGARFAEERDALIKAVDSFIKNPGLPKEFIESEAYLKALVSLRRLYITVCESGDDIPLANESLGELLLYIYGDASQDWELEKITKSLSENNHGVEGDEEHHAEEILEEKYYHYRRDVNEAYWCSLRYDIEEALEEFIEEHKPQEKIRVSTAS